MTCSSAGEEIGRAYQFLKFCQWDAAAGAGSAKILLMDVDVNVFNAMAFHEGRKVKGLHTIYSKYLYWRVSEATL